MILLCTGTVASYTHVHYLTSTILWRCGGERGREGEKKKEHKEERRDKTRQGGEGGELEKQERR